MAAATLADRLRAHTRVSPSGCHLWTGARTKKGYGRIQVGGKLRAAHRVAYETAHGPIPAGHDVEHACHTDDPTCNLGNDCPHRACINPTHLRAVPHGDNVRLGRGGPGINARKTHCARRGHPLSGDNLYVIPSTGGRVCRACSAEHKATYRRRKARRACVPLT